MLQHFIFCLYILLPGVADDAFTGCSDSIDRSVSGKPLSGTDGNLARLFIIPLSSVIVLIPFKDSARSTATLTRFVNFAFTSVSAVFCISHRLNKKT